MEGMEAVIESSEIQSSEVESSPELQQETQQSTQPENPYEPKSSRAYSEWLKGAKEKFGDDPNANKYLRLSKDNHARLYQLQQMEPKGIDGVREKYAAIDSVMHGELKGIEALGALQDELRSVQEIDERLFSGDATALKEMGEEFIQQALPKLAAPILEMVRESNPEAYAAAVLPHFVEALKSSELVASFNGLVDVLNEAPPAWLTADQKSQWTADRLQRVMGLAGKMGSWFNAQQAKAGELPKANGTVPRGTQGSKETTELDTLRKEQETQHWKNNINPKTDQHADKRFDELFRPYDKRLRLSPEAKADLKQAWIGYSAKNGRPGSGITGKAMDNKTYADQMNRYRTQKRVDPNTVVNSFKVEFDKHAKNVLDGLVNQRYKSFLTGAPRTAAAPVARNGVKPAVGVQIVTVKPQNIDYKRTTPQMIHDKKYWTTDNKLVQLQR